MQQFRSLARFDLHESYHINKKILHKKYDQQILADNQENQESESTMIRWSTSEK